LIPVCPHIVWGVLLALYSQNQQTERVQPVTVPPPPDDHMHWSTV
jgi:hypothetical protein